VPEPLGWTPYACIEQLPWPCDGASHPPLGVARTRARRRLIGCRTIGDGIKAHTSTMKLLMTVVAPSPCSDESEGIDCGDEGEVGRG
jgi:hypothetical protein